MTTTKETARFVVTRDGEEYFWADNANACWAWLQAHVLYSWHHATKHEGWAVEDREICSHSACSQNYIDTGDRSCILRNSEGREIARVNHKGRCIDAPCCGCCS